MNDENDNIDKAHKGAWRKGYEAGMGGKDKQSCPYNMVSLGSRGFAREWYRGWREAEKINSEIESEIVKETEERKDEII